MTQPIEQFVISTTAQLDLLFEKVGDASLKKEVSNIHPRYRQLIEASPFFVLATSGPDGLDASPPERVNDFGTPGRFNLVSMRWSRHVSFSVG